MGRIDDGEGLNYSPSYAASYTVVLQTMEEIKHLNPISYDSFCISACVCLSACERLFVSVCISLSLSVCLSVCTSVRLSLNREFI